MFYPDTKNETLIPELFAAPGSACRAAPFWAWNGRLDDDLLRRQIGVMHEMGFGGFFMHSRTGLETPYLSADYMRAIRTSADEAERLGMRAYLYDEDRWPSGAAGGIVTREKRYRRRFILWTVRKRSDDGTFADAVRGEKPALLASYAVDLNVDGSLRAYARDDTAAPGTLWYVYLMTSGDDAWYNGQAYLDTLSPEAVRVFLETTHEAFAGEFSDRFKTTMPAIFTDEPQFLFKESLPSPDATADVRLPWTPDLPETYRTAYGEDILDTLPELLWELPDGQPSVARWRYHDHVCERFTSAFVDQYGTWCRAHGIAMTGHVINEDRLGSQSGAPGEVMRTYRGFTIPGVDVLGNETPLAAVKQTVSAARQFGREGVLSELYGATDWDFDFRGYRYQGDWQAALGITLRVPHLFWLTMAGEAKRDYPASIGCQSPWYREYAAVEDHFARLNAALTRGKPLVRVGVIHPIESYWLACGAKTATGERRTALEDEFRTLTRKLIENQLDFDFISESLLTTLAKKDDAKAVGAMRYETIVVPDVTSLRGTTLRFLCRFRAAGGRVIFLGNPPRFVDARPSDEAVRFAASCESGCGIARLPELLRDERDVFLWDEQRGTPAVGFCSQLREDTDCKWLFLAHLDHESDVYVSHPTSLLIRIRGAFAPAFYDPDTGKTAPLSYRIENGETLVRRTLYANDSLLLRLVPTEVPSLDVPAVTYRTLGTRHLSGKCAYTLSEANVLLLDKAEASVDDGDFSAPDEILRLAKRTALSLGIPPQSGKIVQPWAKAPQEPTHRLTLRFRVSSEIDLPAVHLAVEHPETCAIVWNGTPVKPSPDGCFTDEAIKTVPLPGLCRGENTLLLTVPFGEGTAVEWCYLLGDFGVRLEGSVCTVVPKPEALAFSSLTEQGFPFYGGNVSYQMPLDVPENCDVLVRAGAYRGAALFAEFDGERRGELSSEPHTLLIENVPAGKHTLALTLLGNRFNAFGSLHNAQPSMTWSWPGRWRVGDDPVPETVTLSPEDGGRHAALPGDHWCEEYRVRPLGVLASPEIFFLKKE
ncbi:MAG: hypothetical protein MJ088_01445 [Clostridia bacterium]|nr:hypothetical protein [Clostridia bacterium]